MSTFLFANPKVIDGVASIIDLFGVYTVYNDSPSTEEACRRAMTADMQAMQQDAIIACQDNNRKCQKNIVQSLQKEIKTQF